MILKEGTMVNITLPDGSAKQNPASKLAADLQPLALGVVEVAVSGGGGGGFTKAEGSGDRQKQDGCPEGGDRTRCRWGPAVEKARVQLQRLVPAKQR